MRSVFLIMFIFATCTTALAQEQIDPPPEDAKEKTPPVQTFENTLANCQDKNDNDGDGHLDCDDQDCLIFAVCVQDAPATEEPIEKDVPKEEKQKETGRKCRDKIDNDQDGLVDCHDSSCQRYKYCKDEMYERPDDPKRSAGLLLSIAGGLAIPNYRQPTAQTDSAFGRVPFDPDFGAIGDFKIGYMPTQWLGFGANFMGAATLATNRYDYRMSYNETGDFKYTGIKRWHHIGAFIRIQWRFKRIVPYLDISGGYSFSEHRWNIYSPQTDWDDIGMFDYWDDEKWDDDDWDSGGVRPDQKSGQITKHFTFALTPGVDIYVIDRTLALGARVWLPVVASNESSTDNLGVMFSLTFTPSWRPKKQLKDEYKDSFIE